MTLIDAVIDKQWSRADLALYIRKIAPGDAAFMMQENQLILIYRPSGMKYSHISAMLSDLVTMNPVTDADCWTLTLQLENFHKAVLSFGIAEHGEESRYTYPLFTWRGKDAPPKPELNDPLLGMYKIIPFESSKLKGLRDIYLYLPPDYSEEKTYPVIHMADGQRLESFAPIADHLIGHHKIPPCIIVGASAAPKSKGNPNQRGEEYIPGKNPDLFANHAYFFNYELRLWVESHYAASEKRQDRLLFGLSNSALFAAATTVAHPELFSRILLLSPGASDGFSSIPISSKTLRTPLQVYIAAGTLEISFLCTARIFEQAYHTAGAKTYFSKFVAGHHIAMWQTAFSQALPWLFQSS